MNVRRAPAAAPHPPSLGLRQLGFVAIVTGFMCSGHDAALAGVQEAARLSVSALAEFCVSPLLAGVTLDPPLKEIEVAGSTTRTSEREWWAGNGTILAEIRAKDGQRGCNITMSTGQVATVDSLRIVQQNFEQLMSEGRMTPLFNEVEECSKVPDYFKMFESVEKNKNGYFVKVFLNTKDELGFLLLVGAEADMTPHSCPAKEAF